MTANRILTSLVQLVLSGFTITLLILVIQDLKKNGMK
jgi:hypothetical protein